MNPAPTHCSQHSKGLVQRIRSLSNSARIGLLVTVVLGVPGIGISFFAWRFPDFWHEQVAYLSRKTMVRCVIFCCTMTVIDRSVWLHRTYYQETLKVYARVWDLYIKFYTVFMTANILGLGFVTERIHAHRWPVIAAFCIQNVLVIGTSVRVAIYSGQTEEKLARVATFLAGPNADPTSVKDVVAGSPVAGKLSKWAGYANCAASVCMIGCWIALNFIAL
jgi:hypothetical protein